MNNLLQLKGRLKSRRNPSKPGPLKMPPNKTVFSFHLQELANQIRDVAAYWENRQTEIEGTLISVHYNTVVAKSNRLRKLLAVRRNVSPSENICGAKFERINGKTCHVFTHYVPFEVLRNTVALLEAAARVIQENFSSGSITSEEFNNISTNTATIDLLSLNKTDFLAIILDACYVRKFAVEEIVLDARDEMLVTIYQTNVETKELLSRFGITIYADKMLNDTTLLLSREQYQTLAENAPYLIAMGVTDFAKLADEMLEEQREQELTERLIPPPADEPVVGVIDTHFNEEVYFHEWVEYVNMLDEHIELRAEDYFHGTGVTSIIVDGPRGNPNLEDNCGRFRVKHFGVATAGGFSSFSILKSIRQIVAENRDIKVWNLSLGSVHEIQENSISPEGAELDKIQNEFDVLFVVAGTNRTVLNQEKIGAPADSLNSVVVNSVTFGNESASYTRKGPVLSFFYKPDVSYYGGDGVRQREKILVCIDNNGGRPVKGTSYAAPWVTRKLAFLIYKMGLSREIAKALLIDASAGWDRKDDISFSIGYGIVPKKIDDIIKTPDDEIRFLIMGKAEDYETFTSDLPVPIDQEKHPFFARVTLAYFPDCNRNQGVDYTNTELDVKFGRITHNGKLKSIDNNRQADEDFRGLYEEDARSFFRKWDNVKYICEKFSERSKPKKKMSDSGLWGLNVKSKERLAGTGRSHLNFGVVVTLKEMNGRNRYYDFVQMCQARGWLVNELSVQNQIDIYTRAEQEIILE